MYLISITSDTDKCYYTIDRESEYPWFPNRISDAKMFSEFVDALKIFESEVWKKTLKMSDGTVRPSHEVHSSLNLSYTNMSAEGELAIEEIVLKKIESKSISGKIER